jgi:hypothetical protein
MDINQFLESAFPTRLKTIRGHQLMGIPLQVCGQSVNLITITKSLTCP